MYADFFNQFKRQRLSNPTFASGNIISTMVYPNKHEQPIPETPIQRQQKPPIIIPSRPQQRIPIKPVPRTNPILQGSENNATNENLNRKRKSQSHLSSYGTQSLKNLGMMSGRQVSKSQQKKYDIVSLKPIQQSLATRNIQEKPLNIPEQYKSSAMRRNQEQLNKRTFDPKSYMGMSTVDQNIREERINRILSRPYSLNNADEIFL